MATRFEKVVRRIIREELPVRGEEENLTPKEAARYLRLTVDTLARYRTEGIGPAYVQGHGANGKVLYRLEALREYAKSREVKTKDSDKRGATK